MDHLEFLELTNTDPQAAVRVAGGDVAFASRPGSQISIDAATMRAAALTAGLDPDAVDRTSADYRYGAQAALSSTLSMLFQLTSAPADDSRVLELEATVRRLEEELLEARTKVHVEIHERQRPSDLSE
jgi:hypothetical protein